MADIYKHKPVLLREVLEAIQTKKGEWHIDMTLGGGGHFYPLLNRGTNAIGFDVDEDSIDFNKQKLVSKGWKLMQGDDKYKKLRKGIQEVFLIKGNFADIERLEEIGLGKQPVKSVFYDLGFSSYQLESKGIGLSFQKDEPLDMRFSKDLTVTARDLVNGLTVVELERLFEKYGEERFSKRIAKTIVEEREKRTITSTGELVKAINKALPNAVKAKQSIHPATRVFQALRVAVNDELNSVKISLPKAARRLASGGRLLVVSFHSLEDRIIKDFAAERPDLYQVNNRVITPAQEELKANPRARSAKLRILEKA